MNNTKHDTIQCVIHALGPCITLENSFIIYGNFFFIYLFYTNLNDISIFLLIIVYESNGDQKETLTLTQLSLGMKFLNMASKYLLLAASTAL